MWGETHLHRRRVASLCQMSAVTLHRSLHRETEGPVKKQLQLWPWDHPVGFLLLIALWVVILIELSVMP